MKEKKPVHPLRLAAIVGGVLLAAALIIFVAVPMIQNAADPYGGKIVSGVHFGDIDLSGMTKSAAKKALNAAADPDEEDLVVVLPNAQLRFTPKETGVSLDVKAAVEAAFSIGRSEDAPEDSSLDLRDYLTVNEYLIRSRLKETVEELPSLYVPAVSLLDGERPALDENSFNEDAACPDLLVTVGRGGYDLSVDSLYEKIVEAFCSGKFKVNEPDMLTEKAAEAVDLDAIQAAISVEAVSAQLDRATGEAIPGTYGFGFDREEAQTLLKKAKPGDTVRIPTHTVMPEITGREVFFQDVLGFCQTPHGNNEDRNVNLRLACAQLNGVVLQPGEVLSYNETVGQRTEARGFKNAPAYSGKRLIDTIGGGVCQVSSTLYLSSVYAEMEILDRTSHGYPSTYMPIGLDATVSWGAPDLKLSNSSDYPIKIVAEENEGFVRVWIMGTETRDYYVRAAYSSSSDGYAKSYICKYDNNTHQQLSKEYHRLSSYLSGYDSVIGEIGSNEVYSGGVVKEMPPCEPTAQTLAESRRYASPNTNAGT